MKLQALLIAFFIGLIAGCNGNNQALIVQPSEEPSIVTPEVDESTASSEQEPVLDSNEFKEEIGKAAGLTRSQIKQLIALEEIKADDGNEVAVRKIKAIVPTYLPPGFKVDQIEINPKVGWSTYLITYRDSQNRCFQVGDTGPRGDAPVMHDTIKYVYSPTLGNVELGYTKQHEWASGTLISFDWVVIDETGKRMAEINMNSGSAGEEFGYILFFDSSDESQFQNQKECKAVSFEEASKIVESLQLLNP